MKFEIKFLDSEKYPIDKFIDNILDEDELRQYHVSVSFLDFTSNSAMILANGEFGEYMKEKFQHNRSLVFSLPDDYHNPFHSKYEEDGWMMCGCGWKESEPEHIKRTMVITTRQTEDKIEMTIISRNEIPK